MFIVALTQFLSAVDDREFHRDEARWIHRSVYIQQLLHPLSGYWDEQYWRSRGGTMDEQYRLRAQPPLGSYVMGIGFLVQHGELPDIGFWNMDRDDSWNVAEGNLPSHDQLMTGRRTNAVVGALTVVAIFFVARRLTNDIGGVIAAVFLAVHPLMTYVATFAGSDAVLGLTIALAAVAAYRFADGPTWGHALALGAMIGLGGAAKLSPLGIAAATAGLGVLALLWRWRSREDAPPLSFGLQLLATPIVGGAVFIASYPYLWRSPIENARNLVNYRTFGMQLQTALWEGLSVDSRTEAFQRIGDRLGAELTVLGRFTDVQGQVLSLELAIASAGLVIALWMISRRGLWSAPGLIGAVLGSESAITVIGLEADWARYHLPLLLMFAVGIGVVAGQVAALAWEFSRSRVHNPVPAPEHA